MLQIYLIFLSVMLYQFAIRLLAVHMTIPEVVAVLLCTPLYLSLGRPEIHGVGVGQWV
jgi:hypothetical protein